MPFSYPKTNPSGTIEEAMQAFIKQEIHFMFCRINPQWTELMEKEFEKYYDDAEAGRKMKVADLLPTSEVT